MSDNLHTYIEPELEARITALVLGEVSEFDLEELEQIIAEQPELEIFRRRMEAMHDLLGETVKSEKDEAWKLSDDRRAELRKTFSRKTAPAAAVSKTVSQAQWRAGMSIAACLVVCLVIFSMMTPLSLKRSEMDQFTPEIVSYQAASSEKRKKNEKLAPRDESGLTSEDNIVWAAEDEEGGDIPVMDKLFEGKKDQRLAEANQAISRKSKMMTRGAERKPSAPSPSMAKVIASNTSSSIAIPVPDVDVPDPSVDFGNGGDFGDRWRDEDADAFAGEDMQGNQPGALAMSDGEDDSFGANKFKRTSIHNSKTPKKSGDLTLALKDKSTFRMDGRVVENEKSKIEMVREFVYPTEHEPPELPNSLAKAKPGKKHAFPVTPATPSVFEPRNTGVTLEADGDPVRKNLYMGEGYYNLGKYDEAEAEMKEVLKADPYNKAARRWLEKVAATKSDYYRAAYDHTRAHLLAEVDSSWEIAVPRELSGKEELGITEEAGFQNNLKSSKETLVKIQGQLGSVKGVKDEVNAKPTVKSIPAPKRPQPLPEETSTSAQPFSTFSLNVADVSFKLAKVALLEKGQWPEAAKVRTEEFVNAFDYGDPSPRRGEPVACAVEQSIHPFLQQRNLLRIGMKTAALGRSTPLRLTVLLDNSGSMEREDRESSVLAAIQVLASQLGPQDKITLVGFARQPRLLADRVSGDQAGQLVNIVANTPSEGGTNLEEALRLARKLAKRQHSEGAQDRVVLITDGVANLGNTVPEQLSREIEIMRQEGIAFDACGVGAEDLNDEILEALTRKGDGRYYFLNRPEDADSGFAKQLAGALSPAAKNVKVQVVFNPKRVSKYRLLGFEKHRLNKEDFRNDKVDAAEMAAEEAGNAVYQIEANPDGEGELGEVFVRFLDTNTGQMVERSWPLPYEPQAKSFDLAEPSMQLAAAAAMLGEKLHGTDAGSVRFDQISKSLGKLRAHYAADRKVQDLIRMCERVK